MTYKNVALYKERQQKSKIERYKTLLRNALILLQEDFYELYDLQCELGITEKEYKEIMEDEGDNYE